MGYFSLANTASATVANDIPLGTFVAGTTVIVGFTGLNPQAFPLAWGDTYIRLLDSSAGEVASNDDACSSSPAGGSMYLSRIVYTVPHGSAQLTARIGCYSNHSCGGSLLVWSRLDSNGHFTDIGQAFDLMDGDPYGVNLTALSSSFGTAGLTSSHYTECFLAPGCAVHFQGVARLPIPGFGNILAIAGSENADIFLAEESLAAPNPTGIWRDHLSGQPNSSENTLIRKWSLPDSTGQDPLDPQNIGTGLSHLSGLQAIGQYLATVTQAEDSLDDNLCVVDPWLECVVDNGNGSSVNRTIKVNPDLTVSVIERWEAEISRSFHFGSCAGATKTMDGGFVFAVADALSANVDFYRKEPDQRSTVLGASGTAQIMGGFADIESGGWTYKGTMHPTPPGGFQNCDLFSQIDGTVWLATTGTTSEACPCDGSPPPVGVTWCVPTPINETPGCYFNKDTDGNPVGPPFPIGVSVRSAKLVQVDSNYQLLGGAAAAYRTKQFPDSMDFGASVGLFQDAGLDRLYLYTNSRWTAGGQLGFVEFGSKGLLSQGRPTVESTNSGEDPGRAVDGYDATVASTSLEVSPWWYVDLGTPKHVKEVKVIRTIDFIQVPFVVLGSNAANNGVWTQLTDTYGNQEYFGLPGPQDIFYNPYNSNGTSTTYQYIMIRQLAGSYGLTQLRLGEVQVFGE